MFVNYKPKSITYSTTTNITTFIIIYVSFHSCDYDYVFTKLHIHIDLYINKLSPLRMNTMENIWQYERAQKENTHFNILGDQMLLKIVMDKKLNQAKDKTKDSFYRSGCVLHPIFEGEDKGIAKNV